MLERVGEARFQATRDGNTPHGHNKNMRQAQGVGEGYVTMRIVHVV